MAVSVAGAEARSSRSGGLTCEKVLLVRSHRYSFPSSLLARTDLVIGSTAAELMHHSRTALGKPLGSGVTPFMAITSFITRVVESRDQAR